MADEVRLAAFHEAGHLIVADFLELSAYAVVDDDGSGRVYYQDSDQVTQLAPEDRACMSVAGEVAEAMASGGDLKRAVARTFNSGSDDLENMVMAVAKLERSHPQGRDGVAMDAARAALAIIRQNQSEFNRLVNALYSDRIARVGPAPATSRTSSRGVDYAANLAAARGLLAGGQVAGVAELRNLASKAASDNPKLAALLEATIARREGREVKRVTEFSIGGPAKVILQGEVI